MPTLTVTTANIRDTGIPSEPLAPLVAVRKRVRQVAAIPGVAFGQEIEKDSYNVIWDAEMAAKKKQTYCQDSECPISVPIGLLSDVTSETMFIHGGKTGRSPHRDIAKVKGTTQGQKVALLDCHPVSKPGQDPWGDWTEDMHKLYLDKLIEQIAALVDKGYLVIAGGDLNAVLSKIRKLHPRAVLLVSSGLDHLWAIPPKGVEISDIQKSSLPKTENNQMDHPVLTATFTFSQTTPEVPMPVTEQQRVAAAKAEAAKQSKSGPRFGVNQCKWRIRELYDVDSDGSATASIAAGRCKYKHPMPENFADIPDGALIWMTGGTPTADHPEGAGHVMMKDGKTTAWSTDWKRDGFFDLAELAEVPKKWPKLKYAWWSEDIDGVRVIKRTGGVAQLPAPRVNKLDPKNYYLGAVGKHVTWLGQQLVAHGYGRFYKAGPGPTFTAADKRAVAAFQLAQGWTGSDADGLPGKTTLALLAGAVATPKPPVNEHTAPVKRIGWAADWSFDPFDYADLRALRAAGVLFVVRYITRGSSKKKITKAEVQRIHAAGLGIILVWETTAGRAGQGEAAGREDARDAEKAARALGYPKGCLIYYAVDYDATAKAVQPYFRGVKAVATDYLVGTYGGYKIANAGFSQWNWQTVGWSKVNGVLKISPRAQMLQKVGHTLAPKGVTGAWDENEIFESIPTWKAAA